MEPERQDLRVVIAGHVDHGKSTIIGRLLADSGSLLQGKLEQIREKCRRTARPFEYAFLLDALKEEQAQGITIEAARCFFKTASRNYIITDAPGHTDFIKNMLTGAARADAALIVVDADEGVKPNSVRHGLYLAFLGVTRLVVVVNKMDLIGYDRQRFGEIVQSCSAFLRQVNMNPAAFIPVSGMCGDNIAGRSENMPWYEGETLLEALENMPSASEEATGPFRMPVQDVYKFTADGDNRRIVAGTVASGCLQAGDEVVFYPSGRSSRVRSVEYFGVVAKKAETGQATGFTLQEQIYVRRGELAAKAGEAPPRCGNRIMAEIVWLGKLPLRAGNRYFLKLGTGKVEAVIDKVLEVFDVDTLGVVTKSEIGRHETGRCIITLAKDLAFDAAADILATGRFVFVEDYDIAGAGVVLESLERQERIGNLYLPAGKVARSERCRALGQSGLVIWFTGLSGAGKSTIAIELERELVSRGRLAYRLDGDNIRDGLNADLDFTIAGREENIRRVAEVAKLFCDSGMITLVSFISPLRRMREHARSIVGEADFIEVFVNSPLETCIARDTKRLYARALSGEIGNFTGISSPYEEPDCPALVLDTGNCGVGSCVAEIIGYLAKWHGI